jgi:hypothetical protein
MTDAKVLMRTYPLVIKAVAWTELIICQSNDGEQTSWDMLLEHEPDISPPEMVKIMKEVIEGETMPYAEEVRKQMDHPQYLTYIAGKLGAC